MSRALRARVVFTLHVRVRICMWLEICCDPLPRYIAVPSLKSQISGPIGTALDSSSLIPLILLSAAIGRRPPAPRPPLAAIDVPWEPRHLANGEVPRILSRRRRRRSTKRELLLPLSLSISRCLRDVAGWGGEGGGDKSADGERNRWRMCVV